MDSQPLDELSRQTRAAVGGLIDTHRITHGDLVVPAAEFGGDPQLAEFFAAYHEVVAAARSFGDALVGVLGSHAVALRDVAGVADQAAAASAAGIDDTGSRG